MALGEREHDPATADIRSTETFVLDLDEIQSLGASAVARLALKHVSAAPDGYWVHLDLDVLDNAVMPAVDSPQSVGYRRTSSCFYSESFSRAISPAE